MHNQPISAIKALLRPFFMLCLMSGALLPVDEIFLQGSDDSIHTIPEAAAQHSKTILQMYTGEFLEKDEGRGTEAKPLRFENLNKEDLKYICIYLTHLEEIYSTRKEPTSEEKSKASTDQLYKLLCNHLLHETITKKQLIDLVKNADFLQAPALAEVTVKILGQIINWDMYKEYNIKDIYPEQLQDKIAAQALTQASQFYYPLAPTPTRIIRAHSAPIDYVTFFDDNSLLCSRSINNVLKIWHIKTGKLLRTINGVKTVYGGVGDKFLIFPQNESTIAFTNVHTGTKLLANLMDKIITANFSHDGKTCAVEFEDKLHLFSLSPKLDFKFAHDLGKDDGYTYFTNQGKTLITISLNGFNTYAVHEGVKKISKAMDGKSVLAIKLSKDATQFLKYDLYGNIDTYDISTGAHINEAQLKAQERLVYLRLRFLDNKTRIAAQVIKFDLIEDQDFARRRKNDLALIHILRNPKHPSMQKFTHEIKAQIIDTNNGQPLLTLGSGPSDYWPSSDGQYAVFIQGNKILFWHFTEWWQNYMDGKIPLQQALFIRLLIESCDGDNITLGDLSQINEGTTEEFKEVLKSFPADVQSSLKAQFKLQIKQPTNKEDASTSA